MKWNRSSAICRSHRNDWWNRKQNWIVSTRSKSFAAAIWDSKRIQNRRRLSQTHHLRGREETLRWTHARNQRPHRFRTRTIKKPATRLLFDCGRFHLKSAWNGRFCWRGSAAGSAVAYCTASPTLTPLRTTCCFERFLNPDRVSLPDIDIDFDDEGRDKVLKYVIDKYGQNQVAQIIAYGTMAAKSAIRDCARVMELPLNEANVLAKLIPERPVQHSKWLRRSTRVIRHQKRNRPESTSAEASGDSWRLAYVIPAHTRVVLSSRRRHAQPRAGFYYQRCEHVGNAVR